MTRLFSQNDDAYDFEPIPARRLRRKGRDSCLCCSILKGFLDAVGGLTSSNAVVRRDDHGVVYQKDGDGTDSDTMEVYTLKTTDAHAAARPIPFVKHLLPQRKGGTSSSDSLEWVMRQLTHCVAMHPRCTMLQESFLPTRLIKVTAFPGSRDVALVTRSEASDGAKYIALSHCWGKSKIPCLTTKNNYAQQKRRISWVDLTQTFQNAVDFTRRLGIDFLWIDSICIIQGDPEDWLQESTQMCSIYQNAYATLVAVHAQDGGEGLYSNIAWTAFPFKNKLKFNGQSYQLYTRPKLAPFHSWHIGALPRKVPLFDRAWCYQERIVSPRTIFFTEREILWECFSETTCECAEPVPFQEVDNPKLHHIAAFLDEDHDALRADILARTTQTGLCVLTSYGQSTQKATSVEDARQDYRIRQWHNVVEYCSELNITNELDRLPAVGAIAEQYQRLRRSDIYLAGLWKSSLVNDLAWYPTWVETQRITEIYLAPSWSWVSVRSSVQFTSLVTQWAVVLAAECHYVDNKTFGLATSGMITLKGWLLPFTLRRDPAEQEHRGGFYLWQERYQIKMRDIFIDGGHSSMDPDSPLFALELGAGNGPNSDFYLLLGKVRVNGDDAEGELYSRLGCVVWSREEEEGEEARLSSRCPEVATMAVCRIV